MRSQKEKNKEIEIEIEGNLEDLLTEEELKQLEEDVEKFKTKLTEYAAQIEQGEKEIKELREKIGANNRLRQELIVKQNTEKIGYERACYGLHWP